MKAFIVIALLVSVSAYADDNPFANGDRKIGQQLVEKNCISCHAASFGGDGSGIYTRKNRRITSAAGLLQQVRNCSTNLDLQWFEDEEIHVASYLNDNYYKFKK